VLYVKKGYAPVEVDDDICVDGLQIPKLQATDFDPIRKICTTLGHSTDSYEADMKLPSPDVVTLGKDSRIGCDST
jgi:hypothetical protein